MEEYEQNWRFINESANTTEEPYMDMIIEDKYAEVHKELRIEMDKLMRLEYELLRKAHCKDMKIRYRPSKKPKKKKKKKKKSIKKAKKLPDSFQGKSLQIMYDEMINTGVIASYPRLKLNDYIGDMNFCAYEMRNYLDR